MFVDTSNGRYRILPFHSVGTELGPAWEPRSIDFGVSSVEEGYNTDMDDELQLIDDVAACEGNNTLPFFMDTDFADPVILHQFEEVSGNKGFYDYSG